MTVVEDGPEWLVLWLAPGTPVIWSPLADGRDIRQADLAERFELPRVTARRAWRGTGILKLVPRAAPYSVWLFWAEGGRFLLWYGNLEDVHRRDTGNGLRVVDTVDHVLDVVVPAGGAPEWKDEDEFAVVTGRPGFWDSAGAEVIRAQGESLMELAGRGVPPFDHTWTAFCPDPAWPVPELPVGWDVARTPSEDAGRIRWHWRAG